MRVRAEVPWGVAAADDSAFFTVGAPGERSQIGIATPTTPTTTAVTGEFAHEIGHAVMDETYGDNYPSTPNCNPHSVTGASSAGCAWSEGFAEWYPASVYNDPYFRWPNGSSVDLESATWGSGNWANGDTVEGRVAGALIDISDYNNEAPWDTYGEARPGNIWTTFTSHRSTSFSEFWSQRASDGFNTADSGARSSVYQNTIDYDFRDPLSNYVQRSRPVPTPHNYGYSTSTYYWSVIAVRPPAGADYDLRLYTDRAQRCSSCPRHLRTRRHG